MPENEHIDPMEKPQKARDIARQWAEMQGEEPKRRQMGTLDKILQMSARDKICYAILIGTLSAAATLVTICALRPSQYDIIKKLPVAEYVVRPGDTFYELSERFIQDQDKFEKGTITSAVIDMNDGKDPAKLRAGTTIMLPVDGMTPEQVAALGGYLGE